MSKQKSLTEVVATLVDELTPLVSEDRHRAIQATLTLLGEQPIKMGARIGNDEEEGGTQDTEGLSARSQTWMRQNGIIADDLHQVFHISNGGIEVIAPEIPGRSNRDKVRNAYVLLGIAMLISSGESKFDDKSARALCVKLGFYDKTNHMKYMKGGNEFIGSKEKGWTLTAPGMRRGAEIIKEIVSSSQ